MSQLGKFAKVNLLNHSNLGNYQLSPTKSVESVDVFENSIKSMIEATETAAVEVSMLLRQSFGRFKDSEEEFHKVCQLAIEHLRLNDSNHL